MKPGFHEPSLSELWSLSHQLPQETHGSPEGSQLKSQELPGESEQGSEEGTLVSIAPLCLPVSAFGWVLGASLSPALTLEGP